MGCSPSFPLVYQPIAYEPQDRFSDTGILASIPFDFEAFEALLAQVNTKDLPSKEKSMLNCLSFTSYTRISGKRLSRKGNDD